MSRQFLENMRSAVTDKTLSELDEEIDECEQRLAELRILHDFAEEVTARRSELKEQLNKKLAEETPKKHMTVAEAMATIPPVQIGPSVMPVIRNNSHTDLNFSPEKLEANRATTNGKVATKVSTTLKPKPPVIDTPLKTEQRNKVGRYLLKVGIARNPTISHECNIPPGSLGSVLNHPWFELMDQGWALTAAGKDYFG